MNNNTKQNIESNPIKNNKIDIFNNMINYFELTPKTLEIKSPYNLKNALDYLKNISLEKLSTELKEIIKVEEKNIFFNEDQERCFSLDNIKFLSSKLCDNDKIEYILLKDLKKENYI